MLILAYPHSYNCYVFMRKYLLVLLLTSFVNTILYAQTEKVHTIKSIRGEYSVILTHSDVTGREAMQLARENAKRKALEKVCGSRISIWDQMETSSAGDVFNSLSVIQTDGEIVEFSIIDEGHKQSQVRDIETIFYCIADVKVKKSSNYDPSFNVTVNGLKSVYYTKELLLFDIVPYQNCYMKIFLFEDNNTGYMLYPNSYDRSQLLPANKKFSIANSSYEFELQKKPNTDKELNKLVFVFTKNDRPFNEQITSRSEIEKWIATIPNDQKYLHFAIIEIRDK